MTTLPPEGNESTVPEPAQSPEMPAAPAVPQASPAAPPAPGYAAPPQPGYPQQGVPPEGYAQPGYAQPGYAQGAPAAADPAGNLVMNYWLSVFFAWLPALIFFIIDKDKANPQVKALNAANLNFSLLRTAVMVVGWFLVAIPVIGWLIAFAANVAGFILHIMAATKVQAAYQSGQADPFMFNIPLIK